MKNILITGISGQDGVFLSKKLLLEEEDLKIVGISRQDKTSIYNKLQYLGVESSLFRKLSIFNLNLEKSDEVKQFLKDQKFNYVYNLTGPSSIYKSINKEYDSKLINIIFDNLTNSLIQQKNLCNFFQASSSEMFAQNETGLFNENSEMHPRSPYATAKYKNHKKVLNLRKEYEWKITSGILFNHESEFRGDEFLIKKIINSAIRIKKNKQNSLVLGSTSLVRDWSYASDICEAIYLINTINSNSHYVVGSGRGTSIGEVVKYIFNYLDLNFEKYLEIDISLLRRDDPGTIICDNKKLIDDLNWKPQVSLEKMLEKILKFRLSDHHI